MKRFIATMILQLLLVAIAVAAIPVVARQKAEPQHKMVEFHMALLKRGPEWTGTKTGKTESLESEQKAYASSLIESGKAVIAGRLTDDGEIRGVYVFRAKSPEEAKA